MSIQRLPPAPRQVRLRAEPRPAPINWRRVGFVYFTAVLLVCLFYALQSPAADSSRALMIFGGLCALSPVAAIFYILFIRQSAAAARYRDKFLVQNGTAATALIHWVHDNSLPKLISYRFTVAPGKNVARNLVPISPRNTATMNFGDPVTVLYLPWFPYINLPYLECCYEIDEPELPALPTERQPGATLITLEFVNLYKGCHGDSDLWHRSASAAEKSEFGGQSWGLLDEISQGLLLINQGLAAPKYADRIWKLIEDYSDSEATTLRIKKVLGRKPSNE